MCRTCVAWLLVVLGCAGDDGPLQLANGGREVVVPERYRACSKDADCVLASIACDSCCQRDAVTKELQAAFDRDRNESCSGYSGAECDCEFVPLSAVCEDSRCVALEVAAP